MPNTEKLATLLNWQKQPPEVFYKGDFTLGGISALY